MKKTKCLICGKEVNNNNLGGLRYGSGSKYSPYKVLCGYCYNNGKQEEADKKAFEIDRELNKRQLQAL